MNFRKLIILASLSAVLLAPARDAAAQVVSREYSIKAGVLNMLRKCVTWPANAAPARGEPLIIGILGKDPFVENEMNQLDRIVADEKQKGANIVLKRFHSASDYEPCQILFVSNQAAEDSAETTMAERVQAAKKVTAGTTVLIVGESTGLAQQGFAANIIFDRTTNLIRLEINPDVAARAGLKLAPDLLRLKVVQIVRAPAPAPAPAPPG